MLRRLTLDCIGRGRPAAYEHGLAAWAGSRLIPAGHTLFIIIPNAARMWVCIVGPLISTVDRLVYQKSCQNASATCSECR